MIFPVDKKENFVLVFHYLEIILMQPTECVDVQAYQLIWKIISILKDTTSLITSHALEEAEAV